jgi:hypothetical protein
MKRVLVVSIGLLLLVGCGPKRNPSGSISGTITYKGKPVNRAILRLHSSSGDKNIVRVPVTQEGTFNTSDIPPGEYKITVEGNKPPPGIQKMAKAPKGKEMDPAKAAKLEENYQKVYGTEVPTIAFPAKYNKVESTDLTCTITQGKNENLTLELKD